MPKHYKIANIPEYLSHEMAIEVQKKLNSGYTLEFKSDFKDGSIWVLSKMVTWDEFNKEVKKEHIGIEKEKKQLEEFSEKLNKDLKENRWFYNDGFKQGLTALGYLLAGMIAGHILTIL